MIASKYFEIIKGYIAESVARQDSSYLVDKVRELNLKISGEANYMRLNCSYYAPDGSSVIFTFKSYDPSGPFQNIPDVNKVKLLLLQNQSVIAEVSEAYDDKSVYG